MGFLPQNHGVPAPAAGSTCVDKTGKFVAVTLKHRPQPLVLTETIAGNSEARRVRQLGAVLGVNVVPRQGASVRATREFGVPEFWMKGKVLEG
jgi:hypothetical protein